MTQYNKRYNIVLPDGRTEEWTQDQLTQAGGALMTKYPGAEVSEIMEQEQPAPQQQENNIFKPMDVGEMSKRMTSGNALQNFADQSVYVARNPESEYAAEDARRQQEYKESKLERYKEYKRDAETPEEKSFIKGEIKTLKQDIEAGKSDPRVIKGKETYYDAVAESQADIIAHTNVSLGDEWTGSYGERLSALWEAKALTQLTPQQTAGIEDKVFTDEQRAKENYVYAREFAQQAQDLTMSPIDVDQKGQVKQAFGYAAKKYVSDPTNAVPAINSQMMFRIREIMEKLQAEHIRLGEPEYDDKDLRDILTDDEATLFEAYVAKTQAEAIRQNDKLRGYQGANIALESMPFMVEMLVGNKLIGGTEKVAKYALSKALKGQMNKLIAKGAGKFVQKLVRYGEGYAMDLGLRATKVGLMTTFAPSTKDRIGEKMVEVENGQLARTRAGAITSGYLSNYKEFFTETAGEVYGKAWDAALDLTGIDNIISKYVTSNIPDLVKKGWKAFNNSVLVDAGFNGAGEILEEVEGAFLDRVAGDKEAWREFWKGDNLLEMVIGFAPMTGIGLVQSAGQVAAQAYVDNQITDAERSFKRAYSGLGWTDTQWKNWFNYAREHADADVTARSVADMLRDFENRYVDQVLGDDSRMTDDEKLLHLEAAQKMGSALLMEYTARSAESALEESEKENIKNDILKKLNPTERTNIKFWHDDADKTVSLGTASYNGKPAQVYIVSEDASGVHAIAPDGKSINVPAGKVKRRVDMSLDQYLTAVARSSRAELEELSKGKSERALRKGVQKDLESGKVMEFDLGGEKRAATYGGMQNGMVIAHFEDVVELNGKTGTDIPVSVEEAARALGMNVFSYDEMRKNGIDHLAKGMALRNDLNDRFHGRGFISDGQQYRFRKIYKTPYQEAGEDMVDVVAYDQDGMMRNVSMKVSDLESQTPVSVEQSSYSLQDGVTATGEQLPMKHLEDGSMVVDEQALLEQDLQAWAKYHDEITGDGGADTWSYLTDVLSSDVAGRISELREGLKAERLFSKREQIREEIARNEDKLRKIVEVKKGYVARKVAGINNTGVQVIVSDSESVMNDMVNCSESERGSMSYAMETGMQVRGVYSRSSGQVFLFADMIETIDQAGITFIHEQEHSVTHRNGNNRKLVHSLLGEAFDGLDIEKLEQSAGKEKTEGIEAVIALRSTFADIIHKLAGTGFYDNVGIYTLADEAISHMVEAAYAKGMTVSQTMMGYGIPADIANLVETITSKNRYERREEYYPASESAGDAYGSQRSGVDSTEDAAGAGEGQQLERPDAGSVPGSEGEETLGFSVAGDESISGTSPANDPNYSEGARQFIIEEQNAIDAPAEASGDELLFTIREAQRLEDKSMAFWEKTKKYLTEDELKTANGFIATMASIMEPYLEARSEGKRILPEEVFGKGYTTIFNNGSYGRTMENTTKCLRTLAYNDFVDAVKDQLGRPLTTIESFLASQMLYDIAVDPQCLYCYVSLDRKAYDDFLLRFIQDRDKALEAYRAANIDPSERLKPQSKKKSERKNPKYALGDSALENVYKDYLAGREDSPNQRQRFNSWIDAETDPAKRLVTLKDLTTEEKRSSLKQNEEKYFAAQIEDAEKYAQGASWAKKQEDYRSYNGELLEMSPRVVNMLRSEYGLRFYSFSEYSPAFIVENMQMVRDASLRGLNGLGYTKELDFVRVFAPTGMNINMSCFGRWSEDGQMIMDTRQGADWDEVKGLREKYSNAGAVFVATDDAMVEWALDQDWIDVIIPFHIVRTGTEVSKFYEWVNHSMMQADTNTFTGRNQDIMPTEHHNDKNTFLALCASHLGKDGSIQPLKPRFADLVLPTTGQSVVAHPNYMKLVNETRRSIDETTPLKPVFDLASAISSFDEFVERGGYYGDWYTVDTEGYKEAVNQVVEDIKAGRDAKDVNYGRQDIKMDPEKLAQAARRQRQHRQHGNTPLTQVQLTAENQSEIQKALNLVNDAEIGQKPASEGLNFSVSEETPEDLLYSIIGEKGARILDEYEETTTRLDNLNVARDMEQQLSPDWKAKSNDVALKIKMATGWERGADGKWRYEVEDVDIKPLGQWLESKKKLKLRDIVSADNPVMKAYPDLLDIDVLKGKSTKFWKGSYNSKDKTIELPFGMLKRFDIESLEENPDNSFTRHFKKTLLHEVQHAVQYREGFARGGNPDMLSKDAPREQIDNLTRTADEMAERYRNMSESERLSSEGKTLYADTLRMYDRINYLNRAWRIGESGYKALGGEVESRNVESRMMIPMEERRNQLLAQTEDVDRKQQLLMFEDIEAANSLFSVAPASDNAEELRESNLAFSIVTDQAEIDRLNNEPYIEFYHAMQKIAMPDGKTYLFPPMAAIQGDGYVQGIPVNEDGTIDPIWEKADERQDLAFRYTKGKDGVRVPEDAELTDGTISIGSGKNKKEVPWKFYEGQPLAGEYNEETGEMEPSWYFSLKKGNKGDKGKKLQDLDKVAFDPYQHSAFNPVNDQFTTAYDRSHLVIVKVRVPVSEANGESGYKAERAKLGVGTHEWTGGKLKTKNRRQVVLSRWDMPVGILSDEEVAKEWKKVLDENGLKEVPFNIVTPGQREALIDLGVKIGKPTNDNAGKAARGEYEAWKSTTQEGLNFSVANNNQEVFISNALASLDKIPMKSGNAQAWINKIQQAGGLKKEEDKWIGLTDWLKEQKGDISKDDVAEYIREHQVRIKEVNYGMNLPEDAFEFDYADDIDYAEVLINDWEKAVALYNKSNEDQIDVNDQTDENWEKVEEFGRSLLDKTINPQRENYTTEGLENKREIALVVPTIAPYKESDDIHFGDAGEGRAIGWARFGDAMDEDGNRVLVIDEVQSNRHQDGKEKGYSEKGFPSKMDAYSAKEKAFEDFDRVFSELSGKYSEEEIYEMRMSEDDNAYYKDVLEKRKEANRIYNIAIRSVPDAPFRDSWDALIMKRMLRLASEEGYDKIAWTNGQMQGDRYGLEKTLSSIGYSYDGNGNYAIQPVDKNGNEAFLDDYSEKDLPGILGKETAAKIIERAKTEPMGVIEGDDLQLQNVGMRYFYDEKLVNWMNKYGKKWGIKVSDLSLPGLENEEGWHSVDVTPEMKESVMQGQLMFSANNSLVGIHNITEENLRKALKAGGLANPSVAVVDISQRGHDQFGAISLILPSYMIDKTSGNNAGTWTDDVWTPIYPRTRTIFTERGYKNFVDAINKYGSSKSFNKFYAENERDQAYLGKDPDLMWLFLNEIKGIDTTTYEHPGASGAWEDIMDDYKTADKFLKDYQNDEKLRSRTLSLILRYVDSQIEKNHPEIAQITKQEDETFREYIRRKHDAKRPFQSEYMDENGNYTSQTIKDAFNEQKRLYKVNGLVDNLGTKNRALSIINRRGWSDEYWKWHGKRLEELGVKEEIRDGNDRNGNARWKPATVENASKAMNNQALTGANTMGGWGTFISKIARHMTTLDSIRAEKGHLGSDEDARKAKEKFNDMAIMLHDRQPSLDLWNGGAATALANIVKNAGNDIAKFLKTRYHIELDESELAELEQFVSDVKNMKSDYFETKFQRPVDINEFVAAVVPNKTSQDLIDKLESYGLAVRKYNPNKEGDLWRAQKLASREEGIRFSAVEITPEVRAEMEQIQALARLNGTYLKAPNGADTNLNPEQWAMVRTKKFKAWFGDWEVAYRLEKLKNSSPLIASGNEYQGKYELNRDSAQQYIINNLRTSYTISDTGESIRIHDVYEIEDTNEKDIQLANRGAKKVTSHSAWSDAHLKSVALIPDLIKKSIFITEEPAGKSDAKFDSYRYYLSGLNMGGEDYTVLLVIGVKQGKFYYDHYLTQIEKGSLIETANSFIPTEDEPLPSFATSKDSRLWKLLQKNYSKIVDENGEPMVVYRGQDWSEDANGKMTSGLFVSLDRDFAEGYGEVMPLFVRSINPFNGEKDAESLRPFVEENFDAITKEYDEFFDEGEGYEDSESLMNALKENWWIVYEQSDILRNEIIRRGYDSIFIREDADNIWLTDSNQIKSATNNNGEFSRENDDIRFSVADNKIRGLRALERIAAGEDVVYNAMNRKDLVQYGGTAEITFYFGTVGEPRKNYKGGYGISHIAAKHGVDSLFKMLDLIASAPIERYVSGNKTVVIGDGKYQAVLALTRNGNKESWLLSGWERITNADENSEVSTQTIPTQTNPTFSREDLGAALDEYKGKKFDRNSQSIENDLSFTSVADNNSNTSGIIKPIYTGLFVQDKAYLEERYPSELPNKYYDHMTSVFRPGRIDAATLGEESDLHIIGRLTTDKVDALLVESEDTNNEHPHITLATADGVKPVASNKEIAENPDKIVPLDDYIRVRKGANMGGSNVIYGLNFSDTPEQNAEMSAVKSGEMEDKGSLFSAGRKKVHFTGEDIAELFGGKPLAENLAELSKAIYEDKFSDYSDEFRQKMTDMVLTEGDPIKAMASFIHGIAAKTDLTQDEQKFVENLYQYVLSLTSIDNFGINDTLWAMDEYITSREQKNNDSAQDSPVQDNVNYLDEFIDAAKDAQDDIDTIFEMEREALNEFMSIEKAITKTRNVDRYTAKRMVRLIDSVLAGGLIDNESRSEVKSLLGIVRDAVGMTDIAPEIKKLRRIIVNNTMRRLGSMYNKILEKKAVKVGSKKIVEQGSVDLFGQKMKEAYMEGRDMFIEVDGEYQASDRLKKLIEDNSGYDASGEVDSEMEARFIGYSVAKDYIEGLRTGLNNIDLLQQERSDTYAAYNNDEITGREKNVRVANIDQRLQEEKESILLPMMDHIDRLSNFFSDRHKKAIEFLEADRRRKYDIFKDADMDLAGVSDSQESITREERSNWHKVTNSGVFRVLTASLGNFDTILKALGRRSPNGEGFLWNRFMRQWIDSTNEEYEGISEADTILNAKASEVFGKRMLWKDLYEVDKKLPKATITYRSISGKEETRELSQASLLYIILASGMADGRMKLEAMGISEDMVNNIRSLIDPRFLELGNWLVNEFLPSRREKYNARHEEIFGASMSQVENYFPIVVNKNARYNEFEATRVGQEQRLGNTITGGIIKRTVNSLPLDIIGANAFSIAYGNVQQMEHWYAFGRFNRDMKDLLSNTSVRNRLRHMESPYGSGETFLDNFEKIVTIAEGEYRPAKVIDSKAVNLGRNFTAACISFRLHTAMKQVLSFPAFISEANTVELAKCLANPAASWNWAMENMPVFKKRWLSRQAGNHVLSEADDFKAKALEWAARVGMTPNAFVDAITVSIGARAIYLTKKKRYLDYGFSEEQAHMKALQDAMIGYNETQQSNEGAFLSEIQKQNTWFTTSLTMFRNSSFGYGRMAMNATIDLVRRQQDGYKEEAISAIYNRLVKEGLSSDKALDAAQKEYKRQGFQDAIRIANFTVGVTFAWNLGSYAVYLLFGKDDDKKKEMLRNAFFKGLAGGWAEGLMGGSMVSEAIANWLMGKEIGSLELGTMPVLDALDKLIGNLDKKDWWMAAHDFINMMVQATTGVNPQAIEDVAMSIYDIAGGDLGLFKEIGLGIARLLQVPQSQLDEFYFDEIDMTGDRAMEMTVEEIATIYAERRAAGKTGIVTPLYPDSDMKNLVDKYRKKYEDEVMNRSMLGVRYDDIRNYSESVVKKADRLLERANGGDESADRKLMELYARDEYGRAVTFLEKDKEISKMFKDAMDTGNLDEMRKLITDANDEKTLLEMDFANESPDYLEQMSNRYLGYTKGFLARMSDIDANAPRTPKELTERQQAEYDVAIKYVNAGKASIAEGNKLKKEDQARYDEALAKVNELTNIDIPDDIRSSREWQVYNKLKNSGKIVVKKNGKVEKVEFVPNNVAKAEQDFKKEKDPEMKKIMKGRIEAEKLRFAQIVYDLMQDD